MYAARRFARIRTLVAAAVAATAMAACADTTAPRAEDTFGAADKAQLDALMAQRFNGVMQPRFSSPHKEAGGFQFVRTDNNTQLYAYRDGQSVSTLSLAQGTSYPVQVLFYDKKGRTLNVCSETDHDVNVTSQNTAVLSYSKATRCSGSLAAGSAGSTLFQVDLLHYTTDLGWHPDWTSPWISASVN